MTRKRIFSLTLCLLFISALFNYGPMFYRQLAGNGGTWVQFYHYDTSPEKLLTDIVAFKQKNKQLWPTMDTSLYIDQGNCIYIPFYINNNYYHVWVNKNATDNDLLLIFGGVSATPNYKGAKLINRDMGFLSRQKTLNLFKTIVLNRLTVKSVDKTGLGF